MAQMVAERSLSVSRRRVVARAAALGAAVPALAACGVSGAGSKDTAAAAPVHVTVTFPGGAVEDADFAPVMQAIHDKYPNIIPDWMPGTGIAGSQTYPEKLFALVASDSAPDVFKTQGGTFGQFAESGAYRPLDDYIKKFAADVKLDDFFPQHVEGGKYKGKQLHLANDGAPTGMWVNVDLFQREGLALPTWDWTWADLIKAATALTKRDSTGKATQLGLGRPGWDYWIWSAGGDFWTADGKKMVIDQPPALQALTWMQEAVHKYRVAPLPDEQADKQLSAFENGRIAMIFGVRGGLGTYRSITSFTYDAAPLPKGPKGRVARLGLGMTSIWKGSKVPDQAFSVLNFICSPEGQYLKISRGYAHPSRKSLVEQPWYRDYKTERSFSNRINTVYPDTLKRGEGRAITPHPREADITSTIDKNLADLWTNSKTPADVARGIVAETSAMMVK
jgi:multiple sugar transport system substrate-binding protein